jgi:hypothetical protein
MAKNKEPEVLTRNNWSANFVLFGNAKVGNNTFSLDERSKKSDWIYNRMSLGVDCGEKHGTIYCQMMGGYGIERQNEITVHGKKEDGSDDYQNTYRIAWEDREDPDILKDIGDNCFITIAIELDSHEKLFYKRFLHQYDAINYLSEHLADGTNIRVSGTLQYQYYNGNLSINKNVNRITLSTQEPAATFTQSILIDEDSIDKESLVKFDKDKGTVRIYGYILERLKEFNGHDLTEDGKFKSGQFVPFVKEFEFLIPERIRDDKAKIAKAVGRFFKVKKGTVSQINFDGYFVEGGATVLPSYDDLGDEFKELVDLGLMSEEEAIAKCATNGARERRMILKLPHVRRVTDKDGNVSDVFQEFHEAYTQDALNPYYMIPAIADEDYEVGEVPLDENGADDDSWLDELDLT